MDIKGKLAPILLTLPPIPFGGLALLEKTSKRKAEDEPAEENKEHQSEEAIENELDEDNFVPLGVHALPDKVFRVNDIRGIAETEITPQFAIQLGRAFAKLAKEKGQNRINICRDGRLTSPALSWALKRGLVESGCKVSDFGAGPTPLLSQYLSTHPENNTGIMITASHNPKE